MEPCSGEPGERGERVNLNALARRLQTALCQKGIYVRINQFQSYSEKQGRMVTKYVVTKPMFVEEENKMKNVAICESYQMIDVVQALAGQLRDSGGGP